MQHSQCTTASRRETRKQDRRESILAVAAQTFLDHGYAGTTMNAIAAALGGSKGTLWSYFPSKEELFAAVVDNETAAFRSQLSRILEPCADLKATLIRFCTSLLERLASPKAIALNRLVTMESGRIPEVGRIFYEQAPSLVQAMLAEYLASGMEKGLLRKDDPKAASRLLLSLCKAGCHQELLLGVIEEASPEQISYDVAFALDIFLRAYAPE